jgi:hypothetical protein
MKGKISTTKLSLLLFTGLFTACTPPEWKGFKKVSQGLGYQFIERFKQGHTGDAIAFLVADARLTDAADSARFPLENFELKAEMAGSHDLFPLTPIFKNCYAGDSLIIQMSREVFLKQPFAHNWEQISEDTVQLFRLHLRVTRIYDSEGYENLKKSEAYSYQAAMVGAFKQMVQLNAPQLVQEPFFIKTYSMMEGTGIGNGVDYGLNVILHFTVTTGTGNLLFNTRESYPIPVQIGRKELPPAMEKALIGAKRGQEVIILIPYTENEPGRFLKGLVNETDNLFIRAEIKEVLAI